MKHSWKKTLAFISAFTIVAAPIASNSAGCLNKDYALTASADDENKAGETEANNGVKDLSDAVVSVDTNAEKVTVTVDGEEVPSTEYTVTYAISDTIVLDEFPNSPGTYYAIVTANDDSKIFAGIGYSKEFTIKSAANQGDDQVDLAAEITQEQIEKNIVGTWITEEKNGKPALTNEKFVLDYVSPDEIYASVSLLKSDSSFWHSYSQGTTSINGNVLTITVEDEDGQTIEQQFTITDISSDKFSAVRKITSSSTGSETQVTEKTFTFVKVDDLSKEILGIWDGKCTSEGSAFDDGKEHRWEFKNDGTFVYYNKVDGKWVPSDNSENEYFVAGDLLCTRWIDNGVENREWWEIGVKDGKMSWTALRADEDGSTYTASFEMDKVDITGTWIKAEVNGEPALTDEKYVVKFVSPDENYVSVSCVNADGSLWNSNLKCKGEFDGNALTFSASTEDGSMIEHQLTITDMSADKFTAVRKITHSSTGSKPLEEEKVVTFVRADDLSDEVLGTWEGKCTSEGSVFDDGKEHRWEYKKDGSYVYYNKVDGKWVASDNTENEYFVAGNLLCTRWIDNGAENREWWEISVKDGKMSWTALRANEDGSTFTATFEMDKIEENSAEVTQEQIEKNIIGSWILAEKDGEPVLTNEKPVFNFASPTEAYTSASLVFGSISPWHINTKCGVDLKGNQLTLTIENGITIKHQFTITDISSDKFTANVKSTFGDNDEESKVKESVYTFVRVDDLSDEVLGTWEGKCTSEGSVFDDGKEHRWEYKADGTYVYYNKVDGKWVASDNTENEYFVAGNLLCTRWIDNGTEKREWWEISVKDGKMSWTALRADEDGSTYTASFEMKQVKESAAKVTVDTDAKKVTVTVDGEEVPSTEYTVIYAISDTIVMDEFPDQPGTYYAIVKANDDSKIFTGIAYSEEFTLKSAANQGDEEIQMLSRSSR